MKKPSLFGAVCAVLFTAAPLSVHATTVWSSVELEDNLGDSWKLHVITNEDTLEQVHIGASVYLDSATENATDNVYVDPKALLKCHPNCTALTEGTVDAASRTSADFDGTNGTLTAVLEQIHFLNSKSGTLKCIPSIDPSTCSLANTDLSGPQIDNPTSFTAPGGTITFSATATSPTPPPPTIKESIEQLVDVVIDLNLQNGISNALDSKLAGAIQALDDANTNNDVSVSHSLYAFMNSVDAQAGNKITVAEAKYLNEVAQNIIDNLTP